MPVGKERARGGGEKLIEKKGVRRGRGKSGKECLNYVKRLSAIG